VLSLKAKRGHRLQDPKYHHGRNTRLCPMYFFVFEVPEAAISGTWAASPYRLVRGYQSFQGTYCLHLQSHDISVYYSVMLHILLQHKSLFHNYTLLRSSPYKILYERLLPTTATHSVTRNCHGFHFTRKSA
jgi:hypothetical protein